ncbi:MAG: hypothetical protein GWP59_01025 [Chlamydiales bacterium]|nr:hypothetical protein [Chlamydiales bacterium]
MSKALDSSPQTSFVSIQNKEEQLQQCATLCAINNLKTEQGMEGCLRRRDLATRSFWQLVWGPIENEHSKVSVFYNPSKNRYSIAVKGRELKVSNTFIEEWYDIFKLQERADWSFPKVERAQVLKHDLEQSLSLLALSHQGQTLLDFVYDHALAYKAELWLTGHGHGGTLATLLALILLYKIEDNYGSSSTTVYPMSFGAPSSGNFIFSSYFNSLFPYALRVHNTLDVVPYCWSNLPEILKLYPSGPSCPEVLSLGIKNVLEKFEEKQKAIFLQTSSQGIALEGIESGQLDFYEEMREQHSITTYLKLLGAKPI